MQEAERIRHNTREQNVIRCRLVDPTERKSLENDFHHEELFTHLDRC